MKTPFLCVVALAAIPLATPAGAEPDRVERALRKLRQEIVSAVNAGDLERALACWSANARIMIEGRPPIEGSAALESARQRLASSRVVRFAMETERIDHSGNLAYELGRITMTLRGPDDALVEKRGKYLDVWKKHGRSDWRIIVHSPSGDGDSRQTRRPSPDLSPLVAVNHRQHPAAYLASFQGRAVDQRHRLARALRLRLEQVRALLGHARLDTTQVYTTIRPPQLKRAVAFYEEQAQQILDNQ